MVGKNGPNDEDNAKRRRDEFLQRRGMSGAPPDEVPAPESPKDPDGSPAKPATTKDSGTAPPRK